VNRVLRARHGDMMPGLARPAGAPESRPIEPIHPQPFLPAGPLHFHARTLSGPRCV